MKEILGFWKETKGFFNAVIWGTVIASIIASVLVDKSTVLAVLKWVGGFYLFIFLLMVYGFVSSKKLRNGPLVIGTIVSANRKRVNDTLYLVLTLEFYTTDGHQVTASNEIHFNHLEWKEEAYQPGFLHPLRYHPENPEEIMLETEALDAATLERAFNTYSEKVKNGPLVIGTIISTENDIVLVLKNNNPVFNVTVEFSTTDGRQITASDRRLVSSSMSIAQFTQFQPKGKIALRYHPEDPGQIMLAPHEKQKTLERDREMCNERIKNSPIVFGIEVSAEPLGWRIDDMEAVDVTICYKTIDGQEVDVELWMFFNADYLEKFEPGGLIPLQYDPEDTQQISVANDVDKETLQRALDAHNVATGLFTQEEIDVIKHGVKTTGVILSAQPTGNIVNGYGEMTLQVKVTRPDGGTYEASTNKPVRQEELPSAQPGNEIMVHYMPENEENIVILISVAILS
ncbi:MAG: DUF3592 domain-containing protein [Betaproteobacteria bacterium]|nr:DUF3592 domain-containing protein [Betaproteobacteria bacterium]